ncbi:hypothetical protein [Anaeromicropila herbilytica]|uniref:DUF8091 domain-containing protein n=1 Tax=Anaeromicropila herbilytica TaxID=2785025 RepID=A0A7R7EJN2_9FIRM|nr:hypothetical protein [Anaeromicropila herbilytica]BCN30015.1 hypothetical protein bsdtb5_13100 [Anaeromicropila herbilytica]
MEKDRFDEVSKDMIASERQKNGIGTLGEKTLHAILKNYYEPKIENQEIRMNGYVADIVNEHGIIEIQTRSFDKLRRKLDVFLELQPVTIVYPIPYIKWLKWVDNETGEVQKPRKSTRKGTPYMIFPELYKIKSYLSHPNINLCIVMLNLEEIKILNGWSRDKKRGAEKVDRIPTEIVEEIMVTSRSEYLKLIPDELIEPFTSKDYKEATKLSLSVAQTALNVLYSVGAVKRVGKDGRLYLYERVR